MATNAYSEVFLSDVMDNMGEALEYATCACGIEGQLFLNDFVKSGVAELLGTGEPRLISGMSGIELARLVLERCGRLTPSEVKSIVGYSPEYWAGEVYAYYQWCSGCSFAEIFQAAPFEQVLQMYWPLHEADISKTVSILDGLMVNAKKEVPEEQQSKDNIRVHICIKKCGDEGYIACCDEIEDLIATGKSRETAIDDMCGCLLEYAEDYYNDFTLYSSAPNRKHHLPYVEKIRALASMEQVKGMLVCLNETTGDGHAEEVGEQEKISNPDVEELD